jgi:hypothetical protein
MFDVEKQEIDNREVTGEEADKLQKAIDAMLEAAAETLLKQEKISPKLAEVTIAAGRHLEEGPLKGRHFHIDITMLPPKEEYEAWVNNELRKALGVKSN